MKLPHHNCQCEQGNDNFRDRFRHVQSVMVNITFESGLVKWHNVYIALIKTILLLFIEFSSPE